MSNKLLVGRYELIEKIGEGGMAVVYKSKDRLLNRFVAIKILRPEYTKDAQFVDSFRRESQAAAGLQHPNITSVYDVGREGNIHFIVMELVDGKPLSDIIKEQAPMDYKVAIEITKQVASALSLAHRNNIIHRDIKPHNIMLTKDGVAKLGDFGIAKAVSDATLADTSRIMGSVHYFSPEQARGSYVDERSDIYSLGIVLYEMLTGKVPFDGDNPVQVALMHINDEIKPVSSIIPAVPPALEKIVMKATDKFQSNRFSGADEMLEDLKNIEFVTRMVGDSVFVAKDEHEAKGVSQNKVRNDLYDDYEENKKPEKKKNNKKKKIIAIVAGVVLLTAAVFGALLATFGGKKVEVPNVVDLTYSEAKKSIEDAGLKVERGDKVTSDKVEAGKVAKQNPKAYEKVEKGTTVTLNISAGKATNAVPNLVGKNYDQESISALLKEKGFELDPNVKYEKSDKFSKGEIMSQSPTGDAVAEKGTKVSLVVCSGKKTEEYAMPSLMGLTYAQAVNALRKNKLEIGESLPEENDVYPKGTVFWQQYDAGTKLKAGTKVNIKISKGAPNVNPDTEDSGKKKDDK
ncbi:MAG: Stk1 family PASTA domain-containing Ser/Thr kinase [Hornefia sp.]|nr:Stk1 family PASTA domain-containing Ser/Thr kinase [Hornefia sp.]